MISFSLTAIEHLRYWISENRKIAVRILDIIEDIKRHHFTGIGKPEPLKGDFKGYWSRRITEEHRLIYKVNDGHIIVHSCHFHY
ncbi:toxin YoeB [Niabella ginsenosidivorans]|uniref:Putative mRNA interferase YoeB n=1 Tax=Niabella ginsenosidivorans TaxID=1176587 RepID=A0A1A9I6U5_9BACT|nr:Txe/YoeB family addiction module toxin [Niabella ginsenosidivorans]ANH83407.1 toxin YoeB [Niabella ginsenosidivorans]